MKLIYAIVSDDDSSVVSRQLTKNGFFATKLATTGGFLMSGNTTFMICTDDEKVPQAIEIIKQNSRKRKQMVPSADTYSLGSSFASLYPVEVTIGGATIFVTNVEHFEKV